MMISRKTLNICFKMELANPRVFIYMTLRLTAHRASFTGWATLGAMGRRIDPSWGGPIELFLVPASAPRLAQQRPWYVQSCLWNDAYKRTLAANRN